MASGSLGSNFTEEETQKKALRVFALVSVSSCTKLNMETTKAPEAASAGGWQRASSSLPSREPHTDTDEGDVVLCKALVPLPLLIKKGYGMAVQTFFSVPIH